MNNIDTPIFMKPEYTVNPLGEIATEGGNGA